jgi:hypothetical protein
MTRVGNIVVGAHIATRITAYLRRVYARRNA